MVLQRSRCGNGFEVLVKGRCAHPGVVGKISDGQGVGKVLADIRDGPRDPAGVAVALNEITQHAAMRRRQQAEMHFLEDQGGQNFRFGGGVKTIPKGHALGLSVHESFHSYVAEVAEVSVEEGLPKVHRVVAAVDCGIPINPNVIEAQVQGSIGFGLGAILAEKVTMTAGVVDQGNYDTYTPLRMNAMPDVDVHIVASDASPTGIGEPAVPPIGPAVANAGAAATGKVYRDLPMIKDG